jgi:hypothetical protein
VLPAPPPEWKDARGRGDGEDLVDDPLQAGRKDEVEDVPLAWKQLERPAADGGHKPVGLGSGEVPLPQHRTRQVDARAQLAHPTSFLGLRGGLRSLVLRHRF